MKRLTLALLTVGVLAACSSQPTAAKHPDSLRALVSCTTSDGRSGYVVTSGRDTTCVAPN